MGILLSIIISALAYVTNICPEYYEIDPIYGDSAGAEPPFPSSDDHDAMESTILGLDNDAYEALERIISNIDNITSSLADPVVDQTSPVVEVAQSTSKPQSSRLARKSNKKRSNYADCMDSIMEMSVKRLRVEDEKLEWEKKKEQDRIAWEKTKEEERMEWEKKKER